MGNSGSMNSTASLPHPSYSENNVVFTTAGTLYSALLFFVFGSGPIRGFSITLTLGVLASMFTAIMFTNFLIHLWFSVSKKKKIVL